MYARVPQAIAQFVLKLEKLSHIIGTALSVSVPDYGSSSYPIHSPKSAPVCFIFSTHMVLLVPVLFILILPGAPPKPPITVDNNSSGK